MNIFKKYAAAVCIPPTDENIFLDLEASIKRENLIRRFFQRLIKDLILLIYGQFTLDKNTIPVKKMKILWIHYGRLNIGDLLMDFSPRALFENKKFSIDLFTKDSVNEIFINDKYFKKLITSPIDLTHEQYDFIIMQKFSGPIIKLKIKYLKNIPFFCIQRYFAFGNYSRLLFGYYSLFKALNKKSLSNKKIIQTYFNLSLSHQSLNRKNNVFIAVGGAQKDRTYKKWSQVIDRLLKKHPGINFYLVGSKNGSLDAEEIMRKFSNSKKINNFVGKLTLTETFEKLKESTVFLCADGGLMHLGKALNLQMVALFSGGIDPLMRFIPTDKSIAIHSMNINAIEADLITVETNKLLDSPTKKLNIIYR
jgi:heptosyltransferase-2